MKRDLIEIFPASVYIEHQEDDIYEHLKSYFNECNLIKDTPSIDGFLAYLDQLHIKYNI